MAEKPPAPPTPPTPPAPPPTPPTPPTPPAPPADGVPPWFGDFQKTVTDQFKTIGDQLANVGKPAPRDPLSEIDKLTETVKGVGEWVAQQPTRQPNFFERLMLGHQRTTPKQPPPAQQ